ncbi:choice-of-anchor I family protein [Ruegeria marina]|uniref:Hemolysin-type calcium-binding repeat-containing protein n=1 Tax=Ruegeria marina TaxID=639004 RepID=A0A1G6YYU1_9RHOB|nr:choice-of-anchor I family protein [Ruegeria marina]SDD95233.1 Hemolysin-type calcium-binding repeat-containing protein [Ruegeria marina]
MTAQVYPNVTATMIAQFDSGVGEAGSEVVSHHAGQLFVTNGAEGRIDIFDLAQNRLAGSLDLTQISGFGGLNSVSVSDAGIAVAVQNADPSANGFVVLFDLSDTDAAPQVFETGNLPDMVTFSHDGTRIFVANEGERNEAGDPAGSLSIIDVAAGSVQTFGFETFDSRAEDLREMGIRLFPGTLPSADFEPEYVSEGPDGLLYVTLQEANTVAVFNPATLSWSALLPLGTVDHSLPGFALDASDRDDAIDIRNWPLNGLRLPDAITSVEIGGEVYFLTANEGDDRGDFDEGGDAARVGDILDGDVAGVSIDPSVDTEGLERLTVSIIDGDTDGDGDIDVLHSYGSRSFTIFDAAGNVVFDSGDMFERIIAELRPANAFNNDGYPSEDPEVVDENRSDNKGPEPEAIATGVVDGHTLAFIGLERDSGITVFDISNPNAPRFLQYIEGQSNGNVSPEVITFIDAAHSLTGLPQIAASYEVSGTTALYDLVLGQTIAGSETSETLNGTAGGDVAYGLSGDDLVQGNAGDDNLGGGLGNDTIWSGTGRDLAAGAEGDDLIGGGDGNDTLWGGRGDDILWGGAGDDEIRGGRGDDLAGGGTGNDHIWLEGGDTVWGGAGSDLFEFVSGSSLIRDFDAVSDAEKLDLQAMVGIDDFADLSASHMAQIGTSVVILDDAGNTLTLSNVTLADLDANDFIL